MDKLTTHHAISAYQPNVRILTLGGSMTIQHGEEIKAALAQSLAAADEVLLLDLLAVTEIDLIGLQAICAAHRSSIEQGKRLSVVRSGNQAIEKIVPLAGFDRHTGCTVDTGRTCIWTEELEG
ncbi:MAG: STAS domain-containing protein [Desulfobacteraceae bacterium]|nr:STAS domain-containing protein [Desulfobacteraceae bacterium]